jgi:hypothetical protein
VKKIEKIINDFHETQSTKHPSFVHEKFLEKPIIRKIEFFLIDVDLRVSLCVPRLILRILKLTTMEVSSDPEICGIRTNDFCEANSWSD